MSLEQGAILTANTPSVSRHVSTNRAATEPATRGWTFLTNHAHVLILLHQQPDSVLRSVATQVGITERAVQRIVQDLEEQGFLRRIRVGRRNRYKVIAAQHLRHPIESHRKIGELLALMSRT
jgi:DNA-binding MarR family transcriptional regulator